MPSYRERSAGVYRARFLGSPEKTLTDQESGEKSEHYDWQFQEVADPSPNGFMSRLTGQSLRSANSNAFKFMQGILGRPPREGDDTDTYIGQVYDVVYGPNQSGNLCITGIMPIRETAQPVPTTVAHPNGLAATEQLHDDTPLSGPQTVPAGPLPNQDDLPF